MANRETIHCECEDCGGEEHPITCRKCQCENCGGTAPAYLHTDDWLEQLEDLIWQVKRSMEPGKATHRINLLSHIRNHHLH
ncbi:hypothetical protein CMI37_37830 [Candidatus Pacearchaeota archaeon]|nr:hypothetical protein [Candidatus Pacearchaeota archaeon]